MQYIDQIFNGVSGSNQGQGFNGNLLDSGPSGLTDSAGNAVITSSPTKAKSGDTFTFVVTDIVKEGYLYDPNANIETEDSISVP